MYTCKITLVATLLLVSCESPTFNNKVPNSGKPILVDKTDIIKKEFPKVDYVE